MSHRTTRFARNTIPWTLGSYSNILIISLILFELMQIIYRTSIHLVHLFTSIVNRINILFINISKIIIFKIIIAFYLVSILFIISSIILLVIRLFYKVSCILSSHINSYHLPVSHLFLFNILKLLI
jgi:hypothetical protein